MIDYSRFPSHRKTRRRKKQKIIFFLLVILFLVFLIGTILIRKTPTSFSQAFKSLQTMPTPTSFPTPTSPPNSSGLEQPVQDTLQGTQGRYAVVVKNLKTNEYYGFNADEQFESGSLYKLWVMSIVYSEIEKGKIKLTDTLSKNAASLYNEFSVEADPEDSSSTVTSTIQDALYQMITISDNDSALLLTDKIGIPAIQDFLNRNGFSESHVGINGNQPVTSAKDTAMFFEKLYKGKLGNQQTTNAMVTLLKEQRLNEKLPQYLPSNVTLAHKTGEIDGFSHDAGIVFAPDGNYIIVVLTQSDDPEVANERIAQISQAVYKYFNQTDNLNH